MTSTIADTQAAQPAVDGRAAQALSIRQLVDQQMLDECSKEDEMCGVLHLLKNLEPDQVNVAIRCHAVLIRSAGEDLVESGIACWAYFALITPLFNFIENPLHWRDGAWVTAEEWLRGV